MVCGFISRLDLPYYLASKYLIAGGSSFSQVIDHTRAIERECIDTYGDSYKIPCHQYRVICILSKSEDPPDRDQLHLQTISSTQVVSQAIDGSQISYGGHNRQSFFRNFGVSNMDFQDITVFLDQWPQYLRLFQEFTLV